MKALVVTLSKVCVPTAIVFVPLIAADSQFVPPLLIEVATPIVIEVELVVAIVTAEVNCPPKATFTLSGFGEAVSVPEPPPPGLPLV